MARLRTALRETAGGLPGQFWALWTATLINRAGGFVIIFLAIYLTTQRAFTPSEAGLVLGLYGVGGAVGVTAGGQLADRWGRRPTALLAMGSSAVFMIGLGLMHGKIMIMVASAVLGLTAEAARPALGAMIADLVPSADRLRAFSVYYWAINLGFAASAILAGFAAKSGYFTLFVGDALTTAAAAVLIAVRVRESRPEPVAVDPEARGSLRTVLTDRVFLSFVATNLLIGLLLLQYTSMLPLAMVADNLSTETFGVVVSLNGILIVIGQLVVTRLLRRRRPALVLPVSAVVIGVGLGLTAFAHTPIWYAVTVLIWTSGEMLSAPSGATLLAGLSPVTMRGRYQGVFGLSWQSASFLAPVLGGFVRQHAGNTALWLGCLAVGLTAAGWSLLAAPARERRMAAMTAAAATPAAAPV